MDTLQIDSVDTREHSNGHAHRTFSYDHHRDHDSQVHGHSSDHQTHTQSGLPTTSPALIITLSPHVRSNLPDADVLALTQWASSRVLGAFAKSSCGKDGDSECAEVEVTVGVARAS